MRTTRRTWRKVVVGMDLLAGVGDLVPVEVLISTACTCPPVMATALVNGRLLPAFSNTSSASVLKMLFH